MTEISVVIPAHNAERYIGEAVESALMQVPRPMETIVVDDGSTDGTAAALARFSTQIIYVRQDRRGAAAARNEGVRLSRGEFIAFLDADDVWLPGKLASQVRAFELDPSLDLVFAHVRQFLSPELAAGEYARDSAPVPGRLSGAMLIRASSFLKVGEFSTQFAAGEFIDWYNRAREAGLKEAMLPEVFYRRRIHRSNQGLLDPSGRQDYLKVIKQALDRRRVRLRSE